MSRLSGKLEFGTSMDLGTATEFLPSWPKQLLSKLVKVKIQSKSPAPTMAVSRPS